MVKREGGRGGVEGGEEGRVGADRHPVRDPRPAWQTSRGRRRRGGDGRGDRG